MMKMIEEPRQLIPHHQFSFVFFCDSNSYNEKGKGGNIGLSLSASHSATKDVPTIGVSATNRNRNLEKNRNFFANLLNFFKS